MTILISLALLIPALWIGWKILRRWQAKDAIRRKLERELDRRREEEWYG
jgi:hypothetical protein